MPLYIASFQCLATSSRQGVEPRGRAYLKFCKWERRACAGWILEILSSPNWYCRTWVQSMELREEFCAEIGSTVCYSSETVSLEDSLVGSWLDAWYSCLLRLFTKGPPSFSSRSPILRNLLESAKCREHGRCGFARVSQAQCPSRQAATCCPFLDFPGPIAAC